MCNLCNSAVLGDQYHCIFECNFLKLGRKENIPVNSIKHKFNTQNYHNLFNVSEYKSCNDLRIAKFCKIILELFK